MSPTPIAVYHYYWKASEISFNKSIITYTTLNSDRLDQGKTSIFFLYDSNDQKIGEQTGNYFSVQSLISPNLFYYTWSGDINLFDKVIIFGTMNGAIYDTKKSSFLYSNNTIKTVDYLNNPVEIIKEEDDSLNPDKVNFKIIVYEKNN